MKKSQFTEAQVALKQAEAGVPVEEPLRKYGISRATFYAWRKKYMGLDVGETPGCASSKRENKRLKGLVADLVLDQQILQEVLAPSLLHLSLFLGPFSISANGRKAPAGGASNGGIHLVALTTRLL